MAGSRFPLKGIIRIHLNLKLKTCGLFKMVSLSQYILILDSNPLFKQWNSNLAPLNINIIKTNQIYAKCHTRKFKRPDKTGYSLKPT